MDYETIEISQPSIEPSISVHGSCRTCPKRPVSSLRLLNRDQTMLARALALGLLRLIHGFTLGTTGATVELGIRRDGPLDFLPVKMQGGAHES